MALVYPRALQVVSPARGAGSVCIISFTSHSWGMDFPLTKPLCSLLKCVPQCYSMAVNGATMSGTSTHRCPSPGQQRGKQEGNLFCWFCHQGISTQVRNSECLGEGALSEQGSVFLLPTIPTSTGCFGGPFPSQPSVSSASVPALFTPISLSKLKKT